MARGPRIVVDYIADTGDLKKGMSEAETGSSRFASSLKSIGKAGAFAAGAAGVGALVATVKLGIDEWTESTKVTAQTQAVIKSTGKAAGVTTGQVQGLAEAIMKKSGIDDEAVQSGENMLLTFTNVRNEVGKGNDVFNQATSIMADMSTALGQDMTQSALQLGKALNDPVKGVGALRRVGVAFTDSQKTMIENMVKSGDTMGAQKIILRELNKEFGGSAEAMGKTLPGQINILKQEFNNFAGEMVGKVAPSIQQGLAWLQEHWPQISAVIQQGFAEIRPVFVQLGELIGNVATIVRDNWGTIGPVIEAGLAPIVVAFHTLADVLRLINALLTGDWSAAWAAAKAIVGDFADFVIVRAQELEAVAGLALKGLELAAGLVWDGIKAAAGIAWDAIKGVVMGYVNGLKTEVTTTVNAIETAAGAVWNAIKSTATTVWNAIKTAAATVWAEIKTAITNEVNLIESAVSAAMAIVKAAFDAAKTVADGLKIALEAVKGAAQTVATFFTGVFKKAMSEAKTVLDPLKAAFDTLAGAVQAVVGAVQSLIDLIPKIPHLPHIDVPFVGGGRSATPGPAPALSGRFGIPKLAAGAVVSSPTLAMIGEGRGREIVAPEALLRSIIAQAVPQVRVFIGERELSQIVRVEVDDANSGLARTLLAGGAA